MSHHTKLNGIKDTDRTSLIGDALMTPAVTFFQEAMRPTNISGPGGHSDAGSRDVETMSRAETL